MVAPAHVNTQTAVVNLYETAHPVNLPTGTGGILVLTANLYNITTIVVDDATPPPVGTWTLQQFIAHITDHDGTNGPVATWVWTKPAEGGDPSTFSWGSTKVGGAGGDYYDTSLARYTHGSGTPIVNAVATPTQGRASTSAVPAITTTVNDAIILAFKAGYSKTVPTPPSGYTLRLNYDSSDYIWEAPAATAGTFGPTSYTNSGTDSFTNVAIALVAPGGSTPSAISNLAGTAGDTQVALAWTAPGDGGSAITDYISEYHVGPVPTFPTIPTVAGNRILRGVQTGTTATRTFPNLSGLTKNAGDLLIAICIAYQTSTGTNAAFSGWTGGFTEFHDSATATTMAIGCAYKWSTGSETGTIAVTQAGTITGEAVFILLSIPGAHATIPPEAGGRVSSTTSTQADPTSLNPAGWGTDNTLWIAVQADGETSLTGTYDAISAAPTNYTGMAVTAISSDSIGGAQGAVAFRQLNAASEDAGAFTADTSNSRHAAILIAVCPLVTSWQSFSDATSTTAAMTITGLTNGVAYNFHTAAINAIGTGPWSNVAGPYTPVSAATERMKRWNGSAWVPIVLKTGASWAVVKTKKL